MKWFCKIELKKSSLAEVVYADGPMDAIATAEVNTADLVEKWGEAITAKSAVSFFTLGKKACNCDPMLSFYNGDYYYYGRKVSNDMNFNNGFAEEYERIAKLVKLDEDREKYIYDGTDI